MPKKSCVWTILLLFWTIFSLKKLPFCEICGVDKQGGIGNRANLRTDILAFVEDAS